MTGPLRDAWTTLTPRSDSRHGPLPPLLLGLTVVTGLVDAFSYLVLGHVFVANMTGNVVFMAFALAGAKGFSLAASAVALLAFAVGAALGGRLANRFREHRGRLLLAVVVAEALLVLVSYACAATAADPSRGWMRYLLIALLGPAMGAQNGVVRRLGVPDLTTTVLTMTITGVFADSALGGGQDSKSGRRVLSAVAMFLGGYAGALLALHVSAALPLLACGALLALEAASLVGQVRTQPAWAHPTA
ncbi:DUF1275 domain-containing protein [Streptacidiphilus sp. PB12-B1b]|uniref:YoaK family protein n=1 Tax=Streptacidiphilus sp. PB12-B1b TaxID=2705012 RepID=UPI0015F9AB82|nr:YoaK family protein [Streptacidiphilus sp. PB12-B1b]QMU77499.1 DUF1275 domain-containing protein [Streptacidiphilus sp. PB12-B1b]